MSDYLSLAWAITLQLLLPLAFCLSLSLVLGGAAAVTTRTKSAFIRALVLALMFGLYGMTLGFLTGASTDSTAKDAMAALGTALAGWMSYLIAKELKPEDRVIVPASVSCFLLAFVVSTMYFAKLSKIY